MLDSLREAFRQAVVNFRYELRRDIPDTADDLLRSMREELIALEIQTKHVEAELHRARTETVQERTARETCLRREELARAAGDGETANIAREFGERHRHRQDIMSAKVSVLEQELDERRRSLAELTARFRAARVQRDGLSATAGRAGARDHMRSADTLFEELDRMEDRIRDLEGRAGAAEGVDDAPDRGSRGHTPDPSPGSADVEARLDALKREMGSP